MIDPKVLSRHIGEIYDASLDPTLWPATIEASANLLHSCASVIASVDLMVPAGNITHQYGCDPNYLQIFADDFSRHPLINNLMRSKVGQVGSAASKMTNEGFRKSLLYQEWSEPKGHVVDLFSVGLERTATAVIHLGFVRHEIIGPSDAETVHDLGLLFPHYRRAVLIGKLLEHARIEAASFADTLDGLAAGVFLVDPLLLLVHANQTGTRMLDEGTVVRRRGDSLALHASAANANLRRICKVIAEGGALGQEGIAVAIRGSDGDPYVAHVLPLTSGTRRRTARFYRAVAAVFVRSARLERPPALDAMAQLYGLTPAEVRVLVSIVERGGIPAVARLHDVSVETVKTHVKRVFHKTGTSRQADLVKLVAGIVSPLAYNKKS